MWSGPICAGSPWVAVLIDTSSVQLIVNLVYPLLGAILTSDLDA